MFASGNRSLYRHVVSLSLSLALMGVSEIEAAATDDQIRRLSADLTPLGAERNANEAGTIPAWTGGITEAPGSWRTGDHHPDPFSQESPLFYIDSGNAASFEAGLGAGQIAMLARYPEFRFAVYPSHRTAAYPERVYTMTARNAASGELIKDGEAVAGVAEGYPFPLPTRGTEVIWNHLLRYRGSNSIRHINMITPSVTGAFTTVSMTVTTISPYYQQGATLESIDNILGMYTREIMAPPSMAGNVLLVYESLNPARQARKVWTYSPGQRRVRRAPNIAYDSPSGGTDGMHVSDMTDMFNGPLDRFVWELKGKREMYVPYNAYRIHDATLADTELMDSGHLDPVFLRYELHRVWVVEATLRERERHINPRRTFYLDEDSYQILMVDHYDAGGHLWRYSEAHPINFYEVPAFWSTTEVHYDLKAGRYTAFRLDPDKPLPPFNTAMDPADFTPQALRRKGRR